MFSDLEDLYCQLECEMAYCKSIFDTCERANDRDGMMYYSGKIHAYTCALECVGDILKTDEFRTHCGA